MVENRTTYNGLHKTKDDDIRNVLDMHLKSRSIDHSFLMDGESREDALDMTKSRVDDKINGSQNNESNLVTYSSIVADKISYEEHYLSLKSFLAACNGTYRAELLQLLFPVYSVFVIEQIEMGQSAQALEFFQKYIGDHDERCKRDMEELLRLFKSNGSDERAKNKLTEMKKKRYSVVLTSKTVNYFMQHLKSNEHSVLLQTINRHLDIKILDESKFGMDKNWVIDSPMELDLIEEESLRQLRHSLKKLDTLSKTKPSITLHSFVNAYQG